jgi:hypothetical protein
MFGQQTDSRMPRWECGGIWTDIPTLDQNGQKYWMVQSEARASSTPLATHGQPCVVSYRGTFSTEGNRALCYTPEEATLQSPHGKITVTRCVTFGAGLAIRRRSNSR